MDFTREPIVETVITPKEGYKLVVRSSKSSGQEEYFVDAVEVVCFGSAFFFRSTERPKCFLVPVADYEILEVRETRMVLKNVGVDRSIKIAGGRETPIKARPEVEKIEVAAEEEEVGVQAEGQAEAPAERAEPRLDKKRDRRRHSRRRRGKEERESEPSTEQETLAPASEEALSSDEKILIPPPEAGKADGAPVNLSPLLQPPPTLISETIARYRENFKEAFFLPEDDSFKPHDKVKELLEEDDEFTPSLEEPQFEPEFSFAKDQAEIKETEISTMVEPPKQGLEESDRESLLPESEYPAEKQTISEESPEDESEGKSYSWPLE